MLRPRPARAGYCESLPARPETLGNSLASSRFLRDTPSPQPGRRLPTGLLLRAKGHRYKYPFFGQTSHGLCSFQTFQCHIFPDNPLYNISIPRATMTILKTKRSDLVSAFTRTRVPSSDPARTPSITGMERPGSMYPREK